jgi:hypothetical protein
MFSAFDRTWDETSKRISRVHVTLELALLPTSVVQAGKVSVIKGWADKERKAKVQITMTRNVGRTRGERVSGTVVKFGLVEW